MGCLQKVLHEEFVNNAQAYPDLKCINDLVYHEWKLIMES